MLENVHWLGHACFKITGEKVVYTDPFQIQGGETADIILITHDHYDHLSKEDISKIQGDDTVVVVPSASVDRVKGHVRSVQPGDQLTVAGVEIRIVPAYNTNKQFHPKSAGHVGYLFKVDDVTYYHSGDTDIIPEMNKPATINKGRPVKEVNGNGRSELNRNLLPLFQGRHYIFMGPP